MAFLTMHIGVGIKKQGVYIGNHGMRNFKHVVSKPTACVRTRKQSYQSGKVPAAR